MLLRKGVYFVIQEEFRAQEAKYVAITSEAIENMIKSRQFKLDRVEVVLPSRLVTTEISLYLGSGEPYPISRFPRSLLQDEESPQGRWFVLHRRESRLLNEGARITQSVYAKFSALGRANPEPSKASQTLGSTRSY